jgi:uncharacterized protein YhdP
MRRGLALTAVALIALAAILRGLLPSAIQRYVNRMLQKSPGYEGSIGDVDVALWRGAYAIDDVRIRKRNGRVPVPFFSAPRVDLSVEWRALLDGAVVGEVVFDRPELNFVRGPDGARSQAGVGGRWREIVEDLFPVKINRVEVRDGAIHYRDFHVEPNVDVYLHHVALVAHNLTNSRDVRDDRVARLAFRATPMNAGRVRGRVAFDPFARTPSFDFDGQLTGADLRQWNDFTRAYLAVDVESGSLAVYSELLAKDGRFDGYVKPFFQNVEILRVPDELARQNPIASLWESIVETFSELLEDKRADNVASRIPISGTVEDPDAGFWTALATVLRNAFVEALPPRLEHSVGKG